MGDKEKKEQREKNWELVQIKAFTAWLNSYLVQRNLKIIDLQKDLEDGLLLIQFLEIATKNAMKSKYNKKPVRKVQKLENLSLALNYITGDLAVRLVGIGSEDLFYGNIKLILGLIWSLFRKLRMAELEKSAAEGGAGTSSMEEGLLKWVRETTQNYGGVSVTDFKYSFNDGLAFSALINAYDSSLLNYDSIDLDRAKNDKGYKLELLQRAFDIAEEKLNIPKLLDAKEMVAGDPDERSVQLYTSLVFHAFKQKTEREKLSAEAKKVAGKVEDIKSLLEKELAEKEAHLEECTELEKEIDSLKKKEDAANDKLNELRAKKKKLKEEVKKLKVLDEKYKKLEELEKEVNELRTAMEEAEANGDKEAAEELRKELEQRMKELDALRKELEELDPFLKNAVNAKGKGKGKGKGN